MQNKFLTDFIRRQQTLVHEAEDQVQVKKDKKGRKTSRHGTASGEPSFGEITLATLISEKPPKKDVLDFFRSRVMKLVEQDMDMQPS